MIQHHEKRALPILPLMAFFLIIESGCGGGGQHIDYSDFIHFNNIDYIHQPAYPPLQTQSIGQQTATVKKKLQDNVNDPNYVPHDGDAAFLNPGTKIYAVIGYKTSFRLAVKVKNYQSSTWEYIYYEAESNPHAIMVGDWLDIQGKVVYIGINRDYDWHTEIGAIKNPDQVKQLIDILLNTSFKSEQPTGNGERVFIDFHLQDNTDTFIPFYLDTGAISGTLQAPQAFTDAIHAAIS